MKTGEHSATGMLLLAQQVQQLKRVPRQGWLDRGVPPLETESVADHSLGVAVLAWMAAVEAEAQGEVLDPLRVLALAIVHDLPEATIGDWTPYSEGEVSPLMDEESRTAFLNQRQTRSPERSAAKRAAERAAIDSLVAELPPAAGSLLADLWSELEAAQTPEARFVKQADRLETFLQSRTYLDQDSSRQMASFTQEASAEISHPLLASVRDRALSDERDG